MYTLNQLKRKRRIWCNYKYRYLAVKYPFLDKIALRLYRWPRLYKSLMNIKWLDKEKLINEYTNNINKCIYRFCNIKNESNVFLYYNPWWAWDYAYAFIYLRQILYYLWEKKCNVYLIWHSKFKDIVRLYEKYFKIIYIFIDDPYCKILSVEDFPKNLNFLKEFIIDNNWLFYNLWDYWPDSFNIFVKTNWEKGWLFNRMSTYEHWLNKILNNGITVPWNEIWVYKFSNVDFNKINYIIDHYSNDWELVLCNFESKTLSLGNFDKIYFSDYIKELQRISNKDKMKFVVNSVYNEEKKHSYKSVLITKLNFQEVIRLAENNKIKLFISERNWLNDVFSVFYPKISQIIYYPNMYSWYVDKEYFIKKYWKLDNLCDALDDCKVPQRPNVWQWYRKDFFNTIENNIKNYYS